jgi:hypothetical protein
MAFKHETLCTLQSITRRCLSNVIAFADMFPRLEFSPKHLINIFFWDAQYNFVYNSSCTFFQVDKELLSRYSDYFDAMFSSPFSEQSCDVITLKHIHFRSVKVIVGEQL